MAAAWAATAATAARASEPMTAARAAAPVAQPVFDHNRIAFNGITFCTHHRLIG